MAERYTFEVFPIERFAVKSSTAIKAPKVGSLVRVSSRPIKTKLRIQLLGALNRTPMSLDDAKI
jgi:hypothetical protein